MYYKFGEKGSGFRQKSTAAIQDYEELRKKCLHLGELFSDSAFPATTESLFYTPQRNGPRFEWKRPHELIDNPKFFVEDATRFDIKQGEIGDCWLLAAVANLTLNKQLFRRVVPSQSFGEGYAGIFHFRFWQYGKWIDVVIDDRLPTSNGHLMFMHSGSRSEFWSALLEKAYAKLHGSYEALKGGSFGEAVEDMSGGIAEFYDLNSKECPADLYGLMCKAHERNSFMGCSINALSPDQTNKELPNGLVSGHAYSITGLEEVQLTTSRVKGKIPLVRIRNPWGSSVEWKGAWSDGSREWTIISEQEKARLQLNFNPDGEHWMSFSDFKSNFTNLEICNLSPAPLQDDDHEGNSEEHSHCNKHWEETVFEGSWISGVSAGGCRNYLQTYAMNPQYLITLTDHDEDDDHDLCTLIIALMQKNHRIKRKMGIDTLTIGFAVYEVNMSQNQSSVDATDEPLAKAGFVRKQLLNTDFFKYNASVARSANFINLREVTLRVKLPPGQYCVIPSTFLPSEEGDFLLRIFTEKKPKECCENDNEVGIITDPYPQDNKENEIDDDPIPNGYHDYDDQTHDRKPNGVSRPNKDPNVSTESTVSRIGEFLAACCTLFVACVSALNTPRDENVEKVHFDSLDASSNKHADYRTAPASVQNFFAKVAGEDMEIDAERLQQVLNFALKKEFKFDGFSLESCRSMVAMLDDDRSGKLGIDEFTLLWRYVKHWCEVFKKHDKDGNHMMNSAELRNALLDAKMSANRVVLQTLILRYGQVTTSGKKEGLRVERSLSFDAFILCCIKLKHFIDLWSAEMSQQAIKSNNEDNITLPSFTLDKFIETVMYS